MNQIGMTPTIRIHTQQATTVRQTVNDSFGAKMQQGLSATANAVGSAASMAAPYIPGGTVVSAALAGAKNLGSSSSALSAAPGGASVAPVAAQSGGPQVTQSAPGSGSVDAQMAQTKQMMEMQASFNLQFLELQGKMQHESRSFQTVSNVMKNRTDTAKNSIRNIN